MTAPGVNLVGYLYDIVGLGEMARQFEGALRAARFPHAVAAIDLGEIAPRLSGAQAPWLADAELPFDVTVLWCNPDRYGIDLDPAARPGRRLVARWAWELSELPAAWNDDLKPVLHPDRARSSFAPAVRAGVSTPVRLIPMALAAPPVEAFDRRRWNLPLNRPLFLFMFDHHSTTARKNPLGLINAFAQALPDGR